MAQARQYASNAQRQAAYRKRAAQATKQALNPLQKDRRLPRLPILPAIPGTARWRVAVESASSTLGMVVTEMRGYYGERTPSWQDGERGEMFDSRIEAIEESIDALAEIEW